MYRHGSIAVEDIEKVTGKLRTKTQNYQSPEAPGMLTRHNAPNTSTYLTNNVVELCKTFKRKKIGTLTFSHRVPIDTITHQEVLSANGNLTEAAKNLYAALHRLDRNGLDVIIAELMPDTGLGKTINDKLQRATRKAPQSTQEPRQDLAPQQVLA
ncbi:Sua5 family C-terminal domain-containing protein [Flavobacterium lotistagni]|uniref:Sua5 family C-terminal domain-containing protein n=1 Tax=Flavobacterium lotistagni TaxID=2709660 RepID=UPI00293BAD59|nr:Sua5 family C-terminal domain-containing protein [Flavobacterium lotistagni]